MAFAYAAREGDAVVVLRNCYAEWDNVSRWNALADDVFGRRKVED